jgi:hypothetical protein
MNATQHYIGKNKTSRNFKAKTIAQTVERIFRVDEPTERCKRDSERQAEICSDTSTSDGFLKCTFLPKLRKTESIEDTTISKKTEKDFYQSLSQLAKHYSIEPISTKDFEFPYNLALALEDVQNQLKNKVKDREEIRLIQDQKKTYFTSEERYNTGAKLYYIPILPLYRLAKNPKRKQAVQLLQSVCSYLYHIAEVPYYRQQNSYLFWIYEMVEEWITSDEENKETSTCLSEIKQAEQIGDFMEQKIYNHHNLSRFKDRLNKFKIKDIKNSFDNDCYKLAKEIFSLYEQYPNASIYRNSKPNGEAGEYETDYLLSMDKYISFCAELKGGLFQTLFETVNTEFQEYTVMEEPIISKKFDGSNITEHNLDFENRLFPLIEELIYILNGF